MRRRRGCGCDAWMWWLSSCPSSAAPTSLVWHGCCACWRTVWTNARRPPTLRARSSSRRSCCSFSTRRHAPPRHARRLRDRHRRAERLAALAVRASEARATGRASPLVVQVAQLPGALGERSLLGILADHAHLVTPSELARIWCPAPGEGLLRDPGNEARDELLAALATFGPALACLGGTGISAAVDRVVR